MARAHIPEDEGRRAPERDDIACIVNSINLRARTSSTSTSAACFPTPVARSSCRAADPDWRMGADRRLVPHTSSGDIASAERTLRTPSRFVSSARLLLAGPGAAAILLSWLPGSASEATINSDPRLLRSCAGRVVAGRLDDLLGRACPPRRPRRRRGVSARVTGEPLRPGRGTHAGRPSGGARSISPAPTPFGRPLPRGAQSALGPHRFDRKRPLLRRGRLSYRSLAPVERAIITHAHSDHARFGSEIYVCHRDMAPILRKRLGDVKIEHRG